jgi:hypothetical protein
MTMTSRDIEDKLANEGNPTTRITDPKQLADPKIYQVFEDFVMQIIQNDHGDQALRVRARLEDELLVKYPQLQKEKPELFIKYNQLVVLLKFVLFSSRPFEQIEELIHSYLLFAINHKVSIQDKFQDVLDVYNDIMMDGKIAESLAVAMIESRTLIGKQELITPSRKKVPPTIGNWMRDYDSATRSKLTEDEKRGAVQRITYLNTSPNGRTLSSDDRKNLLNIFEIYDWLKFGSVTENKFGKEQNRPVVAQPVQKQSYIPQAKPFLKSSPNPPKPQLPHGESIEDLRKRVETTTVDLTQISKPIKEASKPTPKPPSPSVPKSNPVVQEIRREVATPELPSHVTREQGSRNTYHVSKSKPSAELKVVDDLKKLEVSFLRQGEPSAQVEKIKTAIRHLALANRMYIFQVVNALEQSPLFKTYLSQGQARVGGRTGGGNLSQAEFEAMADLRRQLERL